VTHHTVWCLTAARLEGNKSTKLHQMHEPGDIVRSNKPLHNKMTVLNEIGKLYAVALRKNSKNASEKG